MPLVSGPLSYRLSWSHVLRQLIVNSCLRVPSSLRPTRKSPSTCSWVGHLTPYLYLIRKAILGKLTGRDWDSMNHPQLFHIELQLVVEVTGAFPKGGLTRVLSVTNFIWPYLHQFFDDSHGLKASLKPLRIPFDRYQSRLKAINNGRDIRQINW